MALLPVLNNMRPALAAAGGRGIEEAGDSLRDGLARDLGELLARGGGPDGRGGEVRFGEHDRGLYATDASLYQVEPIGVVIPASVADAARTVRFCGERGVAMLPRGGGTSLAGQCTNRAVVIDMTPSCNRLVAVDAGARTCIVEPGITIDDLNEQLARRETGLFFAPDPATTRQAAVGGCIGNNAAGARSIRYGRTSENVARLNVVLATGERLWLGPNAGRADRTAARLGHGVMEIVRKNAMRIREVFPRTIRRNAGYGLDMVLDQAEAGATAETVDLAKLLCGSEGTLAVTLGAELVLQPTPRAKGLAVVSFESLEHAIEAVVPIIQRAKDEGLALTAIELLDDVVLDAARGNIEYRRYVDMLPGANSERGTPKAALYVEYFGFERGVEEVEGAFASLRRLVARMPGVLPNGVACLTESAAMLRAWALRKAGEPLLHGLPGRRKPHTFVEDNAVPVERLGEFVREFKKIVARHGTRAAYWAHASVGVLHVRPMIDLHDEGDRQRMRDIAIEVADLARSVGGIMSGEHGDGRVRGPLLERFFGLELLEAFREVKRLFDPAGLLNPGNIVAPGPVESITANLRVDREVLPRERHTEGTDASAAPVAGEIHLGARGAAVATALRTGAAIETYFDYSDDEGFGHAVEQCNGAGVCRKRATAGGTMCPSYHATLDERHSTRGRGNALRLAITGQFAGVSGVAGASWNDAETLKTLDLCLSCKACKSECPSNVDIARLKAEYLAQGYREAGGVPLAARVFGHVRTLNRIGSKTARVANWANQWSLTRRIAERVLGIDQRRSLPRFERSLHARVRGDRVLRRALNRPGAPRVVLFADCFTTFNEPRIGLAALRLLASLGYEIGLAPGESEDGVGASLREIAGAGAVGGCCGRAMISTGLLDDARVQIEATLAVLASSIEDPRVRAIVVCEPSCLSAFKDDWLALKMRAPLALRQALAAKSWLVEEFVEQGWDQHPSMPDVKRTAKGKVLLHGHCHQKALWGNQTSARLLGRLVGDRLRVLETGCCGMAGSFGFTRERYDLSMSISELSLMPMVRAVGPEDVVCAPGTSCRHQMHDAAGVRAWHPIELAADFMEATGP